jgi:hypothetical protein
LKSKLFDLIRPFIKIEFFYAMGKVEMGPQRPNASGRWLALYGIDRICKKHSRTFGVSRFQPDAAYWILGTL